MRNNNKTLDTITSENTKGIIFSGGPRSVYDMNDSHRQRQEEKRIMQDATIPVLGICYGMQLMAVCFDGKVEHGQQGEYGSTEIVWNSKKPFDMFENLTKVWMSHNDIVVDPGFQCLCIAKSKTETIAGIYNPNAKCIGFQFHPEVTHTNGGLILLRYFIGFYLFNFLFCKYLCCRTFL